MMRVVRPCVQRIVLDSLPSDQLIAFARLSRSTGDDRRAAVAVDRRLANTRLTPAERLDALRLAMEIYGNTDTTLVRSTAIASELDALGATAVADRLQAHAMLLRAASANGRLETERAEASRLLEIAAVPVVRDSLVPERTASVSEAAEHLADLLVSERQWPHAMALLDSLPTRYTDLPGLRLLVGATKSRYALVGRTAPVPVADEWIGGDTLVSWRGKVHVLEFTAHWCAPCHLSYPALAEVVTRHGASAVGIVLATHTYGYFGRDTALSVDEEIGRDRAMYARDLAVRAAIAVLRRPTGAGDSWQDANQRAFDVKPLPFVAVVDRFGIVRDVWSGWTGTSAARLERDVAAALAEPTPTR